jgi:uncharacterized membrane protein
VAAGRHTGQPGQQLIDKVKFENERAASGETGLLFVPFMLLAWVLVKRHLWLAALCLGLALAAKQLAWFFAPFFLILVLRAQGFKKAALAAGLSGGLFLAFNLPFIIQDGGLWLSSVLAPMSSRFFPLGVGLASLVAGGTGTWTARCYSVLWR